MREIVINTRRMNEMLQRENTKLRQQNGRLRKALRHLQECKYTGVAAVCCVDMIRQVLGEAIP